MTSDHTKTKVRSAADEAHIRQMIEAEAEADRQEMADEGTRQDQHAIYFDTKTFHKSHCVPNKEDFYSDKGVPIIDNLRDWMVDDSREHFISLNEGKELFIYREGYYTKGVEGYLRTLLEVSAGGSNVKKLFVSDVIHRIGSYAIVDECRVEGEWGSHTVLNNVVLNTKTLEITPHTPELYTFSKLKCDFVEGATCPEWMEFLNYALPADEIETLQEMFGYCLVRGYPYQVAFFLLGKGGNGKGVATQILRALLGRGMTSAVPMQHVGNRFFASDLPNRYANISGDTSSEALYDSSMFKMLTGGDDVRTERKGKDAFDFRNHAKIISLMNELMKTEDQSDGFFRRFVLIRFDQTPTPQRIKEKEGFEDRIVSDEMAGVLNWAIEGLARLRKRGGFRMTVEMTNDDRRNIWNTEADRVTGFINECCERGGFIEPGTFHHAYTRWHEEKYGVPPREEQGDITKAHAKYGFGKGTRKTLTNSYLWDDRKQMKGYTGICLKNTVGNYSVYPDYVDAHWYEIMGSQSINNEHLNNEEHLNNDGQIGDTVDKMRDAVKIALRKIKGDPTGFITANEISLASNGRLPVSMVKNVLKQDAEALGLRFTGTGWCE